MYPYRNRWRWFAFGRYSHLVRAVHDRRRVVQDTTLERRVSSLHAWNSVRFAVSVFLAAGVSAALLSAVAKAIPGGLDDQVVGNITTFSTALSSILGLAYLFLTRLLGQLEIDILAILTLEHVE
jgi:hypothetical protein